jgi:hypothetical protein
MRAVWRPVVACGFGLVLALMLDQTVRWIVPPEPISADRPRYLQTVQYHPILGWSGYPNFAETNDGIRYETNSLGYRDREPVEVKEGQKARVLFLGDSFTWGDEVSAEDRFTDLLAASCGSHCDGLPPIHAINRGIIGYGTAQSLLQYLLTRREQPFDIVVLSLFSGNDLTDNAVVDSPSGPRPRLIRCDRENAGHALCLEGVPVPPVVDWPEHRLISPRGEVARTFGWSGLVRMASQRRPPRGLLDKRVADQMGDAMKSLPFRVIQRTSNAAVENRIGQLEDILGAFDRIIRGDGKSFGVLVFPSARVYAGKADDELRDYRAIVGVLNRLDIPVADFYERTKDSRWQDLFFEMDGHWRPSGHEEAATLLRTLLVSRGMKRAWPAQF